MGAGADTHQGECTPETRPDIHPGGPEEAAKLSTVFIVALLTLVGYMNISGDVPEGRDPSDTQDAMSHSLLPHNQDQGSVTDHDIWPDLLNSSEVLSEDMYNSKSHKITQDEIFSNLGDPDEKVEEKDSYDNGMLGLSHPSPYDAVDLSNNVVMFDIPPPLQCAAPSTNLKELLEIASGQLRYYRYQTFAEV